jgi:hypothetical protein
VFSWDAQHKKQPTVMAGTNGTSKHHREAQLTHIEHFKEKIKNVTAGRPSPGTTVVVATTSSTITTPPAPPPHRTTTTTAPH